MTEQSPERRGVQVPLRLSPETHARLQAQATRFNQTVSSLLRLVIVIGLESLENSRFVVGEVPPDPDS